MKKFLKTKFGQFVAGLVFLILAILFLALTLATLIDFWVSGTRFAEQGFLVILAYDFFSGAALTFYMVVTLYATKCVLAAWGIWPLNLKGEVVEPSSVDFSLTRGGRGFKAGVDYPL